MKSSKTLLVALAAVFTLSGCYTKSRLVKDAQAAWEKGYSEYEVKCIDEKRVFAAEIVKLRKELEVIGKELETTNRTLTILQTIQNAVEPISELTGAESWMK